MHKEYDKVGKQNTLLIYKYIKIKSNVCPKGLIMTNVIT